ncbi:MAG: hypothetical protein JSW20_06605 [Nitrospiraceae bacterium]|nr:MAG: hypothetical protein JSW20_06605 [Nitrospiraceae bacterium]
MKKIIVVIILTICLTPLSFSLALHDDESVGKGGAWKSNDVSSDPTASENSEKSIDDKIDKAFQKSDIIIPSIDKESDDLDSDSEQSGETANPDSQDQ